MSRVQYLQRQARAIICIAKLRGVPPGEVANNWVADGFALKWAQIHGPEVR